MGEFESIRVYQQERVLTVALNRPKYHNAFNKKMLVELAELFKGLKKEQELRIVIITGNGKSFCSGADLAMMRASASATYEENKKDTYAIHELLELVNTCPLPVIGRVNGAAFGGGVGLIACCDIVVAIETAQFAFSETRLGIVPAVISPYVLARIGSGNARELFLTGERFDAGRAKELGLIHHIVKDDALDQAVSGRVEQLLLAAPAAQAAAKQLIRQVERKGQENVGSYTSELIARLRASEEGREGMSAFLDGRRPDWLN